MLANLVYNIFERCEIMFEVKRAEETTSKTFRIPISLLEEMKTAAQRENVSLNNFVLQSCRFALENLKNSDSTEAEK